MFLDQFVVKEFIFDVIFVIGWLIITQTVLKFKEYLQLKYIYNVTTIFSQNNAM